MIKLVPPRQELSELALAYLLWDAVMETTGDAKRAMRLVEVMPDSRIKIVIGRHLVERGLRSIECGPQNPCSDEVEKALIRRVELAYDR